MTLFNENQVGLSLFFTLLFPQVNVNVIEAQKLVGVNINPAVYVTIGDEKKHTATQKSTNCPFYNEVTAYKENGFKHLKL